MCGIIGYTGNENCVPMLLSGLGTLEYRGYDSAGIAVDTGHGVAVVKKKGRLDVLREAVAELGDGFGGSCGIGHTRWATHGAPSDVNSHPHSAPSLTLVHNGIIENYGALRTRLTEMGYAFQSETDTEVAAMWLDYCYRETGDPIRAMFRAAGDFTGSFALGVMFLDRPHVLYAMRRDSPLVVTSRGNASLIASDIPATLSFSRSYRRPDENTVVELCGGEIRFYREDGSQTEVKEEYVDWDVEAAQKSGFPHFMLKEICEEPEALSRTVQPVLRDSRLRFDVPFLDGDGIREIGEIHFVACGTAMHAALYGQMLLEKYARLRSRVDVASEFRYRNPVLDERDLVVLISQSGETADTLAALRLAKKQGIRTLAIVNVVGSTVAREADYVLYTRAGPEIAVASTKAYIVQCAMLSLMAVRFALARGKITENEVQSLAEDLLSSLPEALRASLSLVPRLQEVADRLKTHEHVFYIGRGTDSILCTEAALKLKEISYIHCEAYPAGELKHGTISLIEEGTPVIAVLTEEELASKMLSSVREVRSRGAYVVAVCAGSLGTLMQDDADVVIDVPAAGSGAPLAVMSVLQMLAYQTAARMGLDVDRPRNLAKSVTVE